MYESRKRSPISRLQFAMRLANHLLAAFVLIAVSLGIGMLGYVQFEGLSLLDAFLNASMLLGGMGPVTPLQTTTGKLFASCYALYAGLLFLVTAALVFTPLLHRILHKFHWDDNV